MHQTTVLIILDGWGYRKSTQNNAIATAATPVMDALWEKNPHTRLKCSEECVGLPKGQMGNSEVGHLNLGAGRIVYQDFSRINHAIASDEFNNNDVALNIIDNTIQTGKSLHILGLLSPGGIHSHEKHIEALINLAYQRGLSKIFLHGFLDGRDMPPKSAEASIRKFQHLFSERKCGALASLIGRYYAMDRDQNWDRIQLAYDLLTRGVGDWVTDPLQHYHQQQELDEFVKPMAILNSNKQPITIENGDNIIFMNFRADRARALTQTFIDDNFSGFLRKSRPKFDEFATLTQYIPNQKNNILFPPIPIKNTLGEYISKFGKKQLRLAETEKYAHVTFFFSGGVEKEWPNEERILVKSPSVKTYDLKPEMSAGEITKHLTKSIKENRYDLIICNYANPDMVGHTGNFSATVKAIEYLDSCLGKVTQTIKKSNAQCLITADHGNAEIMFDDKTTQPHTAHTHQPVPLIYLGDKNILSKKNGTLTNIAPTILELMDMEKPQEMNADSLIQ